MVLTFESFLILRMSQKFFRVNANCQRVKIKKFANFHEKFHLPTENFNLRMMRNLTTNDESNLKA